MGLSDVSGVLSRYFILGYWVPSFVAFGFLSLRLPDAWKPTDYNNLHWGRQTLVVGALALLTGLLLLGLRYPITRAFEGYWPRTWPLSVLRRGLIRLQQVRYGRLLGRRDREADDDTRTRAAILFDRQYPPRRERVLPTRFGNAFRACESYSFTRYGLDGIALWPRIDPLLSQQEQDLHLNAASDLAFFMNGSIAAFAVGVILPIASAFSRWWAYLIPFALSVALYRASCGAVERVGTERRASIDLHRLEVYRLLGFQAPTTTAEEGAVADAVNNLLLYGIR